MILLLLSLSLLVTIKVIASNFVPSSINLGIIASRFSKDGHQFHDGTHQIAAIIMAIKEINHKDDGLHDNLIPNTAIKFVLQTPIQDFLQGLQAVQYIVNQAFGGEGSHIVIGAGISSVIQILGYEKTCTHFIIELIRLIHMLEVQSRDLSGIIMDGRIDIFGTDIALEFADECDRLGITIDNAFDFFPETPDFSHLIATVKARGILKVFVLLMKTKDTARLLEQCYKAGLFGEGVQVVVTDSAMTVDMFKYMSKNAPVADIMKGIIGLYSPV
eukprot:gene14769-31380_t